MALQVEGASGWNKQLVATIMPDLEKGFQKVKHSHLIATAMVFNFPHHVLKLAVDMYTAQRRIRCGRALCKPVCTICLYTKGDGNYNTGKQRWPIYLMG